MHARDLSREQRIRARDFYREQQGGPVDYTSRYVYRNDTSYHHLSHPFWGDTVLHDTVVGPLQYDLSSGDDNRAIVYGNQHNSFQPATYPLAAYPIPRYTNDESENPFNGDICDMPDRLFGFATTSAQRNRWYYRNNGASVGLRQPHIYDEPLHQCNDVVAEKLPGFDEESRFDSYYTPPQPQPTYSHMWNGL
jgi:hypothetical protein